MPTDPEPQTAPYAKLKATPLDLLHKALGARMVPFAGWSMPLQYVAGVLTEHLHCRAAGSAALFDVSHMGQASLHGSGAAGALEALVPGDIQGLPPGRQRYTLLTNDQGGIIDDLMVARLAPDRLFLVVNASRRDTDLTHIAANLPAGVTLERHDDRALLALQGPGAAGVMARLGPAAAAWPFMAAGPVRIGGIDCLASRSGYTGEDGFEISVPDHLADRLARLLLDQPEVQPAGLGARDSLRLEAGLCLYGQDIGEATTPVEAGLDWVIGRRRRDDWCFPGGAVLREQIRHGCARVRVGLLPEGRAIARTGAPILAEDGSAAGSVTSGGFAPSLNAPVAMGMIRRELAVPGTAPRLQVPVQLRVQVRGRLLPARIVPLPFVPHRFAR